MRENPGFIFQFCLMMGTIMWLASCTYLTSNSEPTRIACVSSCDAAGNCQTSFNGSSAYEVESTEVNLDTPTQTKVGMEQ